MPSGFRVGCLLVVLIAGCGGDGRKGPALLPRAAVQSCLPDVSGGMPALLSQSGCFVDTATLEPAPELIPYDMNSPLWTDGAYKLRYLAVPSPKRIKIEEDGSWTFPSGSVLIKVFGFEFDVGNEKSKRPVETRVMVRTDSEWVFSSYQWNEEGTDAQLLDDGLVVDLTIDDHGEEQVITYRYPAADRCTICHGDNNNQALGPKTGQLNRKRNYDGVVENQLIAMNEIGMFEGDPIIDPAQEPSMGGKPLDERARAYLDANCAHCHRPGGFAPMATGIDFRYETPLAQMQICDVPMKYFGWYGTPRLLPGDPEGSGVFQRMAISGDFRMPSSGTTLHDDAGIDLIADWIERIQTCP